MIDDHELRLRRRLRISLYLSGIRLLFVDIFKALAGLRLPGYRHRSDDARPTGNRREFLKPALAEHRPAADLVALLRYRADDLVTERLHQAAQLFDIGGMRDVVDTRNLDADEDRAGNGRSGFHDTSLACSMAGCYAALRTGFISRRRAETAQPHSWTVPASMTNPRLSRERRRVSLAVAFWGATQTTSTPAGLKKSSSQSSATSGVLNVRRRQSTNATS